MPESAVREAWSSAVFANMRPITERQRRFVQEYLKEPIAVRAAMAAGYSARTAEWIGPQLMKKPHIAAAIRLAQDRRAEKAGIEAETVLREIARIALFDPRRLVDNDGRPRLAHELDDDTAAAVAGIDMERDDKGNIVKVKYRLADKNVALEKLMKHLGLFERDNRQKGDELGKLLAFLNERGSRFPTRR